jgi:hypothetical protein
MQLKPHIVHIVGHTEAHHATTAEELIEACRIAEGAISQCLLGLPDMTLDPRVQQRKRDLLAEADILLGAITRLGQPGRDPFTDPNVLATAAEIGLLDAPHLRGNSAACGTIATRMVNGACVAVDPESGKPIPEAERVSRAVTRRRECAATNPKHSSKTRALAEC